MSLYLTARQYEACRLYASGLRIIDVANRLGVKDTTVWTYLDRASKHLGTRDRRQMAERLLHAKIRQGKAPGGKPSRRGFVKGDWVLITGGRYSGKRGTYVRSINSKQITVLIGLGAEVSPKVEYIQRIEK